MKLLLYFFIATVLFPLTNLAQMPIDSETGKYTYKVVKDVESTSKKELYTRAKLWVVTNLASQESQLNYHDEEAGTVIANGHFDVDYRWYSKGTGELGSSLFKDEYKCEISYTIKISTKENKYRYEITNFSFQIIAWLSAMELKHRKTPLEDGLAFYNYGWVNKPESEFPKKHPEKGYMGLLKELERVLSEIDSKVKEEIASLSETMKVGVLDGDDW